MKHRQQHNDDGGDSIEVVETKPTFVDCNNDINEAASELVVKPIEEPVIDQKLEVTEPDDDTKHQTISVTVRSIGYDMAPFEIPMDMDEAPVRNKFPHPNTITDYHCYLCNRR